MSYTPVPSRDYSGGIYGFPCTNTLWLCGGMSFGSRDYFAAGRPVPPQPPSTTTTPDQRDRMRERLKPFFTLRQNESISGSTLRKMFDCMVNAESRKVETNNSYNRLSASLNSKNPIVLLLLQDVRIAWNNHQVLAYKLGRAPGNNTYNIYTYDPNQSRTTNRIITVRTLQNGTVDMGNLSQDFGGTLYGFFINDSYYPCPCSNSGSCRNPLPNIPFP
jgi:hypothetical protein